MVKKKMFGIIVMFLVFLLLLITSVFAYSNFPISEIKLDSSPQNFNAPKPRLIEPSQNVFTEYMIKNPIKLEEKSSLRLFWDQLSDPKKFDTYFGDPDPDKAWADKDSIYNTLRRTSGSFWTIGDAIATVGSLFGVKSNSALAKGLNKIYSETVLGRTFDADNWERNICLHWINKGDSQRTIMISTSKDPTAAMRGGSYVKAYKSTDYTVPNGTSYKYYFIEWYLLSQKKSGLKVDVRLYDNNGYSKSILEDEKPKIMEVGTPWTSGTQTFHFEEEYNQVCMVFLNDNIYEYFDFYSLEGNKLCQKITLIS
ncbi:MAG: hypothetical protein KKF89_00300 [Nanoarchaeota archaeon]|nr:hypothetical protein [Nanoarchaeota archaeon]MBU1854136.1 hypothetical protein [Nanoarchaeota archaeon]